MQVLIDRASFKVVGTDTAVNSSYANIEVPEDFKLQKTVEVQEGMKQKTNEQGEGLYTKEVFRSEPVYTIVGQDETLEVTEKPIMERIQKTNEHGEALYLEPLMDEVGNVVDFMETIASEDQDGVANTPVMLDIQKTSVSGAPLYWKDIIETSYVETLDHVEEVTEAREAIAFEQKEVVVQHLAGYEKKLDPETLEPTEEDDLEKPIYENVPKLIMEPTEYREFAPILVPNMVPKYVTLGFNPEFFTSEDIVNAKYSSIVEASGRDFILADEFFTEDEIDYSKPKLAHTGLKIMSLLPKGEVTFKPIALDVPTKTLHLELLEIWGNYSGTVLTVNGIAPVDGAYTFATATSEAVIKLINNADTNIMVSAYALTYNEGV